MSIEVKSFPASNGESFFIKMHGSVVTNILIDCGYVSTTEFIINELKLIKGCNQKLDLVILTHIDNDHINGAREIFKYIIKEKIEMGEIWYNDYLKILGSNYSENKVAEEIKKYIDSLAEIEYKNEPGTSKKEKVGFRSAISVVEYLTDKMLENKWNTSFDSSGVYLNKEELIKRIKINDDVSIILLGPDKSILEDLMKDWEDYLIKYVNGEIKVKSVSIAKAFEKYFVAVRKITKEIEKRKCSSSSIYEMLEYSSYDTDVVNRSSITIIIEFLGKKMLFLGDSSPINIEEKIGYYLKENSNEFCLVKVSHHGSKNNLSKKMVQMINCENYLISTNGKVFNHPDSEAIAKILFLGNKNKKIYFNYKPTKIINVFKSLGKDISDNIICKNSKVNDKEVLKIDL